MNKKYIKIIIFILIILAMIFIAILPIKQSKKLKREIMASRENQIKLIKNNLNLIPELINISKGYLINDKNTLKNIIKINVLAKEQSKNFNGTYNNQKQLIALTMELLNVAKTHSPLTTNPKFTELNDKLENLNKQIENYTIICIENSKKLIKLSQLPIYNRIIKTEEVNKIICPENFSEYKENFNF